MSLRPTLLAMAWVATGLALLAPPAQAQSYRTVASAREFQGESNLRVDLEFTGGKFVLEPETGSALYRTRIAYDEETFRPITRYDPELRRLRLALDAERLRGKLEMDELEQQMRLTVSRLVPLTLDLKLGVASVDIDLGGLTLLRGEVKTGASKGTLRFSQPNRTVCAALEFGMGAAEFTIGQLANARCERIEIAGGVGDLTVDFTGDWDAGVATRAHVKIALGAVTLRFPKDLGVSINLDRFLASFEPVGFVKQGSRYVSRNWDVATTKLWLEVDALFGDISVEWIGN